MKRDICIAWSDLTLVRYSVFGTKPTLILNSVNGLAHFGTVTAVMGPSGSGLTSLLHCLNGLDDVCDLFINNESKILLNKDTKIRNIFIDNNEKDFLLMGLTVKQNLMYASRLKNSCVDENIDHEMNVEKVMTELMISDVANNTAKKCSGGELKRLAIGVELTAVDKPNLILMDEPTTGLDSHIATVVSI